MRAHCAEKYQKYPFRKKVIQWKNYFTFSTIENQKREGKKCDDGID